MVDLFPNIGAPDAQKTSCLENLRTRLGGKFDHNTEDQNVSLE
jgi:hypothetical protein